MTRNHYKYSKSSGFTLLEILIAIFIFSIIIITLFSSHNMVFTNAAAIEDGISGYNMAKNCMDRILLDLQSVHLNIPPEYTPPDFDDPPDDFRIVGDETPVDDTRFSRLRFTSLEHVSLGNRQESGVAEIVYYVQKTRENSYVLKRADNLYPYKPFEESLKDPVLCDNLRALTFKYLDSEDAEHDIWDSESSDFKYATPVAIDITMEVGNDTAYKTFQTMISLPAFRKPIE